MKIYDSSLSGAAAGGAQRTQETQSVSSSASRGVSAGGEGGDRVEFSGALGSLSRAIAGFQSSRASRVEALAAQYQSGTLRLDSAATSRALVSEALGAGVEAGLQ